jgi:hypothetical protein
VISILGIDRLRGSGVREMGFVMDLKECGLQVDVITEDFAELADFSWDQETRQKYLQGVGVLTWDTTADETAMLELLQGYEEIYLFGWVWEMYKGHKLPTLAVRTMQNHPELRPKTTVVLDDNPVHRCQAEIALLKNCDRVDGLLSAWGEISSKMYSITDLDANLVDAYMTEKGFPHPQLRTWPMRIGRLMQLKDASAPPQILPPQSKTAFNGVEAASQRNYFTMMANNHPVNVKFVAALFRDGAVEKFAMRCDHRPWRRGGLIRRSNDSEAGCESYSPGRSQTLSRIRS